MHMYPWPGGLRAFPDNGISVCTEDSNPQYAIIHRDMALDSSAKKKGQEIKPDFLSFTQGERRRHGLRLPMFRVRQMVQLGFLVLFLYLFLNTVYPLRSPFSVGFLPQLSPLNALGTLLADKRDLGFDTRQQFFLLERFGDIIYRP